VPVLEAAGVGDGHLKLAVRVGPSRLPCFGLGLGDALHGLGETVRLVGSLRRDDFRGGDAVELRIDRLLGDGDPAPAVRG